MDFLYWIFWNFLPSNRFSVCLYTKYRKEAWNAWRMLLQNHWILKESNLLQAEKRKGELSKWLQLVDYLLLLQFKGNKGDIFYNSNISLAIFMFINFVCWPFFRIACNLDQLLKPQALNDSKTLPSPSCDKMQMSGM